MTENRWPLQGITITDFTWIGAGSFSTKMLADAGATVIKIESNERLDSLRFSPPFKDGIRGINRSGYFADRNTSKKSVTLNLKEPKARDIATKIICKSDVIANNFTPGVMKRLGFDYDQVKEIRPDIVYLAMSMQGSSGPHRDYLGYGLTIGALCGLNHLSGLPDRLPGGTGTNYPDHVPNPCHAVFSVLAALWHRRRTGEGQYIDLAQTEPTIALLAPAIMDYTANGRIMNRRGNDHPSAVPHGVYPCEGEDRWIAIAVLNDAQWQGLAQIIREHGWNGPEAWDNALARQAERRAVEESIATATRSWEARHLMERLQMAGVPAGVVQDAADLMDKDTQLAHRNHWTKLHHLEMGETIYNAPPYKFSRSRVEARTAAPIVGQHTGDVLKELLDMSEQDVAELAAQGVLT